MSDQGRVTAIIPAYNRSHCIGRALESVLAQTQPPGEVLIVDDASTDDLAAALVPFGDQVRCIRHDRNLGAAAARNTGFQAATGDWIAFLDSDDVWHKDKQAQQLAFLARRDLTASCTGFETVTGNTVKEAWRPYAETLSESDAVWGCYTSPGSTLVVRRDALVASGAYDAAFARFEDWDLMLRLVLDYPGQIGFLNRPLAAIHLGSNTSRPEWNDSLDRMLSKHGAALQARDGKLYRQFRSGIALNRAAVFAGQDRWSGVGSELFRAFRLAPVGNWPFRVILGSRLRSLLRLG